MLRASVEGRTQIRHTRSEKDDLKVTNRVDSLGMLEHEQHKQNSDSGGCEWMTRRLDEYILSMLPDFVQNKFTGITDTESYSEKP